MKKLMLTVVAIAATGCPPAGVVCSEGTIPCGTGCIDPNANKLNCGACARPCGDTQQCSQGKCGCGPGTTECNGACIVTASNTANCGGCGLACGSGMVCESGQCKSACTPGQSLLCSGGCVDAQNDVTNCGGCGTTCSTAQACRAGKCTYDAVAACFNTGQVIGLNATSLTTGSLSDLGKGPQSLATMDGVLLSVDGMSKTLYQAGIGPDGIHPLGWTTAIGTAANHILVDGVRAYVVNASDGTLQEVTEGSDAGTSFGAIADAGGFPLGTTAQFNFGPNTYPEAVAKLGNSLWVPLYGGAGAESADAGQYIAQLTVGDDGVLAQAPWVDLRGIDLLSFDAGAVGSPRPYAVVARGGFIYAPLNNLDPSTYVPTGPGLLAKVNPATGAVSTVGLGGSACLNPLWAAPFGSGLAVTCGGRATYDANYDVSGATGNGVALLDAADKLTALWKPECTIQLTLPDGGTAPCTPMIPSRLAVLGNRLFVGDSNSGRIVVLELTDGGVLKVIRGVDDPIVACPSRNVSDILALQ